MNSTWQDFLQQQGAHLHNGIVQHFGDAPTELAASRDGTVLCDLSQFGTLKVSGEDALSFLQNMLSSDVSETSAQHAQISSLNSPKGRMLASFLIWRTGADYFLHLPHSLCAAIHKRLSMYILRAKVKIEDAGEQQICLGLAGNDAEALLRHYFGSAPQNAWAVEQHDHTSIIRVGVQRFQVNTTAQHAPALWQNFTRLPSPSGRAKRGAGAGGEGGARAAGSPCWDWLNIRAGIPVILPVTQEQFVAQMVNLELIGGVNFKKGCYPGQEIVARMHYLGKLKRRMYLAHIEGDTVPQPGDELYSSDMEAQASGMVVNATAAPGGGCDLLAVVQISSRDTQAVHLQSLQGAPLNFLPLPYPIP